MSILDDIQQTKVLHLLVKERTNAIIEHLIDKELDIDFDKIKNHPKFEELKSSSSIKFFGFTHTDSYDHITISYFISSTNFGKCYFFPIDSIIFKE